MRTSRTGWDYKKGQRQEDGWMMVPDVDGFYHEGMEGNACEDEDPAQIITITRKIRGNMEEGRWKMWTARCDQVHRKEDDVTISERENAYAKIKQF
jgi:hypothetical protein